MENISEQNKATDATVNNNIMEMSVGFLRQRRNLMLSSLALLVLDYGHAKIESGVDIFGVSLKFPPNFNLGILPLLFATYFLWRYGQYLYQESRVHLSNIYIKCFERYTTQKFSKMIFDEISEQIKPATLTPYNVTPQWIINPIRFPFLESQYSVTTGYDPQTQNEINQVWKLPFYKRVLNYKCTGYYNDQGALVNLEKDMTKIIYINKEINLFNYWWDHIKALYEALFSTSYFSDFYFPVLLALIAIGYDEYHLFVAIQ